MAWIIIIKTFNAITSTGLGHQFDFTTFSTKSVFFLAATFFTPLKLYSLHNIMQIGTYNSFAGGQNLQVIKGYNSQLCKTFLTLD